MIPRDYITEWRAHAPWVQDIQVEQDLVIAPAHPGQPEAEPVRSDRNSAEALQAATDQEQPPRNKKERESRAT